MKALGSSSATSCATWCRWWPSKICSRAGGRAGTCVQSSLALLAGWVSSFSSFSSPVPQQAVEAQAPAGQAGPSSPSSLTPATVYRRPSLSDTEKAVYLSSLYSLPPTS